MSDFQKIIALIQMIKRNHLDCPHDLSLYSPEQISHIYNGIGPENFPEPLRMVLDLLHPSLQCVALIHDLDFHRSDGSWSGFKTANARFKQNSRRMADANYPWYNPLRYLVRAHGIRFARLCDRYGYDIWMKAYLTTGKMGDGNEQ